MKRILSLFLILALLLTLTACGPSSVPPASSAETAKATDAPTVTTVSEEPERISNIDDFLAAIRPDAEILLDAGDFSLDSASDYGNSKSPYYTWDPVGLGGCCLTLVGVKNLTIRGLGEDQTRLLTDTRTADVLYLKDCENITLEGLSLGHTAQTEACEGGVVRMEHNYNVTLNHLDLYGCGTAGINAIYCTGMEVQNCTIHHCSYTGAMLEYCEDVAIENTTFRNLGRDAPIPYVLLATCTTDVTISDCLFSDNYSYTLLTTLSPSGSFVVQNSLFQGNRLTDAMFDIHDEPIVLDGNTFEENQFRNWYAYGSTHALDPSGAEVPPESSSFPDEPVTPGETVPVSTGEQKEVHVSTADEFLMALDHNTRIILDTELLDLSTASEYRKADKETVGMLDTYPGATENYYWENWHDGPSLVISGLHNLTIQSLDPDRTTHVISATPRYAYVLTFEDCANVTISGFTAGHTKEPGYCTGGVVFFRSCEDMLVDNCGLFGCGTVGVQADVSRGLQVVNSEIYECSMCGIILTNTEDVAISGTLIRDIGCGNAFFADFYGFNGCKNITLDGKPMDGNYCGR